MYHIVRREGLIAVRERNLRQRGALQAGGVSADDAVEMRVSVCVRMLGAVGVAAVAQLVFYRPGTVVHGMHDAFADEQREGARDGRAVHRFQMLLNLQGRHQPVRTLEGTDNEYARRRRPYVALLKEGV